jgi:histone H3/H4
MSEIAATPQATPPVAKVARRKNACRSRHQKEYSLQIPRSVFQSLVREILSNQKKAGMLFEKKGMDALHVAVEAHMTDLFSISAFLTELKKHTTLEPAQLKAANEIFHKFGVKSC